MSEKKVEVKVGHAEVTDDELNVKIDACFVGTFHNEPPGKPVEGDVLKVKKSLGTNNPEQLKAINRLGDIQSALYDLMALQKVLHLALDDAQETSTTKLEFNEIKRVVEIAEHLTDKINDTVDEVSMQLRV